MIIFDKIGLNPIHKFLLKQSGKKTCIRHNEFMKRHFNLDFSFDDPSPPPIKCDHLNCKEVGEFKAPKSPARLNDYYWFCLEHVRAYNLSWNFYKLMSQEEIERSIRDDETWQRPTWRFGQKFSYAYSNEFQSRFKSFMDDESLPFNHVVPLHKDQTQALALFDLAYPFDAHTLKKKFKVLAKKHHPDMNQGSIESEQLFKKINISYNILKMML